MKTKQILGAENRVKITRVHINCGIQIAKFFGIIMMFLLAIGNY